MEKFVIGLLVGGAIGAVLVANNCKMRALVKKSQDEMKCRLDELLDERLEDMKEGAKKAKNAAMDAVEEGVEKIKTRVCKNAPLE